MKKLTALEQLAKEQKRAERERLELAFKQQLRAVGLQAGVQCQFKFHPAREWRFDFAWPERKLAIEVEGGTRSGGRHVRGDGFEKDCEKYNTAAAMGWALFRFTGRMVNSGQAILFVEDFLRGNDEDHKVTAGMAVEPV